MNTESPSPYSNMTFAELFNEDESIIAEIVSDFEIMTTFQEWINSLSQGIKIAADYANEQPQHETLWDHIDSYFNKITTLGETENANEAEERLFQLIKAYAPRFLHPLYQKDYVWRELQTVIISRLALNEKAWELRNDLPSLS